LTDTERAGLLRRLDATGPEALGDAALDLAPGDLAVWLSGD
jgi:hypothetical protein